MDHLMKFGKSMMKNDSSGSGMGNPLAYLKKFDKDGDGNITENGLKILISI